MKIIQHINGTVVDIINSRNDATIENIVVVENIPTYESKEGYSGELKYSVENGLYWDYVQNPIDNEIPAEEFQSMLEEVL